MEPIVDRNAVRIQDGSRHETVERPVWRSVGPELQQEYAMFGEQIVGTADDGGDGNGGDHDGGHHDDVSLVKAVEEGAREAQKATVDEEDDIIEEEEQEEAETKNEQSQDADADAVAVVLRLLQTISFSCCFAFTAESSSSSSQSCSPLSARWRSPLHVIVFFFLLVVIGNDSTHNLGRHRRVHPLSADCW
mmetsp:Transcript_819/g.1892  ORF Transcript_819/g.1892 Transcript_819/m.1892 type:complete len:191 (+) Transcript_819:433-1005(+)